MGVSSRKRKDSFIDIDYESPKRPHLELPSNLQDEVEQELPDESNDSHQTNQYKTNFPHELIGLMYRLHLSVLCSIRKILHEHEYSVLSLAFEDSVIDKFHDIVIRNKNKSAHIHIEYVDNQYMDNDINYTRLFAKKEKYFSVNNYFNSFVKHTICKTNDVSNKIKYLIIYTNSSLDIAEDMKLKQGRSRVFYPFKFDRIDIEKCYMLKDFLFTSDDTTEHNFYQFSQELEMRTELLSRLEFSPAMQKEIRIKQLSEEFQRKLKEKFVNKLVFAVSQPDREELKQIIRNETTNLSMDYIELQENILNNLTISRKVGSSMLYAFDLLLLTLHDMVLHKKISFTSFKNIGKSNIITISYKEKITYLLPYNAHKIITHAQLFPSGQTEEKSIFSLNKQFALFLAELEKNVNIKFFVIYTNANLDIEENRFKIGRGKDFYPFKFDNIDIQKKRYKILRYCCSINSNGLYQFAKEEKEKLLSLLKLPSSKQKETLKLFGEREKEIKEQFLHKLIFATNQFKIDELNSFTKENIKKIDVPYTYEELYEVALRWSESYQHDHVTERVIRELLDDIKNNRSSNHKMQNENIIEEIKFTKSVIGMEGSPMFNKFLHFLTKGEGKKILKNLNKSGINLLNLSTILHKTGSTGTKALKDLHNLWFDEKGNATLYLKTLQENNMTLSSFSSILRGSRVNAASSFEDLFHLWFAQNGKKTQCLKTLEKEKISFANLTSILSGAGSHTPKAFKDLYDLWFDKQGNKTQYLKSLEENKMNLVNMSSILHGAGANAAKAFKDLYDLWFDKDGYKTHYLETLEKEGINLTNVTSILNGAGSNAASTFKNLYNLWINKNGKKVQYLENLQENQINLANMSSIIKGTRSNSVKVFENLYNLWFDEEGKKTRYLTSLEKEGLNLTNMSIILSGAGSKTSEAFKNLYDLWFDENGCKTRYLKTLEENGMSLATMTSILRGAGYNSAKAFKDLYGVLFDKSGNKTKYIKTFEENGVNLLSMTRILRGAGSNSAVSFIALYNLWFDEDGNKTKYLNTLQEQGLNLNVLINVLSGAGINAAKAFKSLHNLWFDEEGKKTHYLEVLENNEIDLLRMCSILCKANTGATRAFINLFDLWFDKEGNKTKYLTVPEENGISLSTMARILDSAGSNAAKAYANLYDLWFDKYGSKTNYLKSLDRNELKINIMSSILYRAGTGAAKSYKSLFDLLFDKEGNKTHYAKSLVDNGVHLANISILLGNARNKAANKFVDLYKRWFDEQGNATEYLLKSLGKRRKK